MSDGNVDSHLVVTSLALLGFNTDEYKRDYPGIAMELPPITATSFDRTNEPLLLCSLHFLLVTVDPDEFPYAIEASWPCRNAQTKAEFKRSVYWSLHSLQMRRLVDFNSGLPPQFWECNLMMTREEIWVVLRLLTDLCLDVEIDRLKPRPPSDITSLSFVDENENEARNELHKPQLTPITSVAQSDEVTMQPSSSVPVRRKSIVQQQTEAFQSLSRINSFIVRSASADEAVVVSAVSSRTQFLVYIDEEQRKVEDQMALYIAQHQRIHAYMSELDSRYKAAHTAIEKAQKRISSSSSGASKEEAYALTEAGRKARVTKLERLHAALALLEDLAQSPLLEEAMARLAVTRKNPGSSGHTDVTGDSSISAQVVEVDENGQPPSHQEQQQQQREGDEGAGRDEAVEDFDERVEAGREQLLQHASLVYAIESLLTRVQAANDMFHPK